MTDGAKKLEEAGWEPWLRTLFPRYIFTDGSEAFAEHHREFWEWVWEIERGVRPIPRVNIWPRGGAKSTSAELAVAMLGARGTRSYCLYISSTQEQADDHVGNIAAMLESTAMERNYPAMSDRQLTKYGNARGWRRNRLMTASGFIVDAMGLDSAARGVKLDEVRPDLMVFDDIDDEADSINVTAKKERAITRRLLPAGSNDVGVLMIQNKVHRNSIFAKLADGRADWLADRIVSGPIPALENFSYEDYEEWDSSKNREVIRYRILTGTPTWLGQDLDTCTDQLNSWGPTAFLAEAQHETEDPLGGLFDNIKFRYVDHGDVPELVRTTVWCDPAVTDTDRSDSYAIAAGGIGMDNAVYAIYSWEGKSSPESVIRAAILKGIELGCLHVGVETDQGGDTWESVYKRSVQALINEGLIENWQYIPRFVAQKAGSGFGPKAHRVARMLPDFERGEIFLVRNFFNPTYRVLERALRRFPARKPFDLADAEFWMWADLRNMLDLSYQQDFALGAERASAYVEDDHLLGGRVNIPSGYKNYWETVHDPTEYRASTTFPAEGPRRR